MIRSLVLVILAGCIADPRTTWCPSDGPFEVRAAPAAAAAMLEGCAAWREAGVVCVASGDDDALQVEITSAGTRGEYQPGLIRLRADVVASSAAGRIAAHELGHAMGAGHLAQPGHVMSDPPGVDVATTADLSLLLCAAP